MSTVTEQKKTKTGSKTGNKSDKTGLSEKIGLFIDKTLTFGGGLQFDQSDIDNAVEAVNNKTDYEVKSYRDIKTQDDFDLFKDILKQMDSKKVINAESPQGKDGGVAIKMKRGGMVSKNTPKTRSKPSVAGRLAKRGYGKAFKGK